MKALWYCGTDKDTYKELIQYGVLLEGAYFTPYLDTALTVGGPVIISAILDLPEEISEWTTPEALKMSEIHSIREYAVELLHYSKKEDKSLREYPDGSMICEACDGWGKANYVDLGLHLLPKTSTIQDQECLDCLGKGYLQLPSWFTTKISSALMDRVEELRELKNELDQMKTVADNATEMAAYWKQRFVGTQVDLTAVVSSVNSAIEEPIPTVEEEAEILIKLSQAEDETKRLKNSLNACNGEIEKLRMANASLQAWRNEHV